MNLLLWRFVMNKKEFLDILYEQLSGQMPEGNVAAHVQYYRNYIEDAVTQGRTETEVLNELGDPRLIARTLLDTDSTLPVIHRLQEAILNHTQTILMNMTTAAPAVKK